MSLFGNLFGKWFGNLFGADQSSTVWPLPSNITNLPARGAWELPGGLQAIWVFGASCFLMVPNGASGYTMTRVGTLLTATGPVCIRDNGAGGTVCIVDGPYGYYYTIASQAFTKITDPAFLGADRVAFIDGWWIFNEPGTQRFYTNAAQYSLEFSGSNFALIDAATDNLITLQENKEELWLVGEKHTEIWYDSGGQYFAFSRLVSTMLQIGCAAKHSITRYAAGEAGLVWLAKSERGENVVVKTQGFAAITITTPAISNAIATYSRTDDATGYCYQEDTHEFYVLTFPTADVTWVYDFSTDMWHRRASYDPYSGLLHRHRSSCFLNFQNTRMVGDYQNGAIWELTREAYMDGNWPLLAKRVTPHVWDGGARERVFQSQLQIEFTPGVGNQSGMGVDPQAVLRVSNDGGKTYGNELPSPMGKVGEYRNRCMWRRLTNARDRVYEVSVIDPVRRDVAGATLKRASAGGGNG